MHGGALLVSCLAAQGVQRVFCIPGESFLAALDGFHGSDIEVIVARHEGGAAMMAEATGKLTGRPGIAFVTRGPGATNASSGVHVAFQDSTPMILFVGQVARDQRDREAFQEIDYRAMFGPLAKWVAEIDDAGVSPNMSVTPSISPRPGARGRSCWHFPKTCSPDPRMACPFRQPHSPLASHRKRDVEAVIERLDAAARPLVIVGGGGWSAKAAHDLGRFAESMDLPVGASFRCQDYLDNRHPNYVGDVGIGINPALAERVRDADVILALGARLGEMTTSGYTLLAPPVPKQCLIHVHPDPFRDRPGLPAGNRSGRPARPLHRTARSGRPPAKGRRMVPGSAGRLRGVAGATGNARCLADGACHCPSERNPAR